MELEAGDVVTFSWLEPREFDPRFVVKRRFDVGETIRAFQAQADDGTRVVYRYTDWLEANGYVKRFQYVDLAYYGL